MLDLVRFDELSLKFTSRLDIESQITDIQAKKREITSSKDGVSLGEAGNFYDTELYDNERRADRFDGYNTSIAVNDEQEEDDEEEDEGLPTTTSSQPKRVSYTAPKSVLQEVIKVLTNYYLFIYLYIILHLMLKKKL